MHVKKHDAVIFLCFFLFAVWFFGKSFGFDKTPGTFWVARHQVGDFGLHLALARSISYGANFPMELPFYPGKPLAYHYGFDLLSGLLERAGVRLDSAINGLSVLALMFLFWGIYAIGRSFFRFERVFAALAASLSIVGGGLAPLIVFLRHLSNPWFIPDYIYKGPFDGSDVLIFFTPNVYLNQRHLVAALAMHIWIFYGIVRKKESVFVGLLLGLSLYFHSLLFIAASFVIAWILISEMRWKSVVIVFVPALLVALPQIWIIISGLVTGTGHPWFIRGFFNPLRNMGLTILTIPAGLWLANNKQRLFFIPFLILFILGNIVQFSFRPDHNHSVFNLIFIIGNFYTMVLFFKLSKIVSVFIFILITGSGMLNLMAVKNDFRYPLPELTSPFVEWAKSNTPTDSIFLSSPDIIDPVVLAGRFAYPGAGYYLSVLGYNDMNRDRKVDYVLVSEKNNQDAPVDGNIVYKDEQYTVYKL